MKSTVGRSDAMRPNSLFANRPAFSAKVAKLRNWIRDRMPVGHLQGIFAALILLTIYQHFYRHFYHALLLVPFLVALRRQDLQRLSDSWVLRFCLAYLAMLWLSLLWTPNIEALQFVHIGQYVMANFAFVALTAWLVDRDAHGSIGIQEGRHIRRRFGVEPLILPLLVQPDLYRTEPRRCVVTFVNPAQHEGLDIALALAAERADIPFEFVKTTCLGPKAIKQFAWRLAAHRNIRFIRRTDDMRPIYRESHPMLMPSHWEAWGRAVSDAQISGIPGASSSGGLPEAVGPGGVIVKRDAPLAAWRAALDWLWDDPVEYERFATAAARHAARLEMQPGVVIARMTELIEALRIPQPMPST